MKINFNYKIEKFIEFCKENSIEIYLVGGALRDYILDIPTFDYDFALTSDYSKAVEKLSKKYNFICNDKYQAIKLKLDEYSVEITHARVEQGIKDNRHPLNVEFIDDIKLDSKRRDFTINALYYKAGTIYDFYNGLYHIKNKDLIVIGDTLTRFKEDSLRMLRMIRFACYGYKISNHDKKIIFNNITLVKNLSHTAFYSEFDKILLSKNVEVIKEYKMIFEVYLSKKISNIDNLTKFDTLKEIKAYLDIPNNSRLYKYRNINIIDSREELAKLIYRYSKELIFELVKYYDKLNDSNIIVTFNDIIASDFYDKRQLSLKGETIREIVDDKKMIGYYIDEISYAIIEKKLENNEIEIKKYILERQK